MELSQKMDKEKQDIDTQFIDQSWQNMSELLDKEMPVQKRKRRFLWVWFLGLVALITAVWMYHYNFGNNQKDAPKIITSKTEKIAQVETLVDRSPTQIEEKNNLPAPNKFENKKQNVSRKNSPTQNNKLNSTKTVDTPSTIKTNATTEKYERSIVAIPVEKTPADTKNFDIIPQSTKLSTSSKIKHQKEINPNFARLPLPAFSNFPSQLPTEFIPIVQPVVKKSTKWRFGLYAGGLTNAVGSFRAGLHSNLIINPKWTLHAGLGYARRIKNNTTNNNDFPVVLSSNPVAGTNNDPNTIDPAFSNSLAYKKFQYFELPILFQYQIRPKWTIDFGGQIALFHGVYYQSSEESNFTTDSTTLSNADNRIQDLSLGAIATINFAAIGGISYQITPGLSAYSAYHHSTNYLTNTDSNKRWQQIEVGVRYYFK